MRIDKINNNCNFQAGNVLLKRVPKKNLPNYNVFKKIAEDKGIDLLILKNKDTSYLKNEQLYYIVASKDIGLDENNLAKIPKDAVIGQDCVLINNALEKENTAVKLYNTVIMAIERFEKKLKKQATEA